MTPNETNPIPTESKCKRCGTSLVDDGTGAFYCPIRSCVPTPQPEVGEWEEEFNEKCNEWCAYQPGSWAMVKVKSFFREVLSRRESEWRDRAERALTQVVEAVSEECQHGCDCCASAREACITAADKAKKSL